MDRNDAVSRLLNVFSLLADFDLAKRSDAEALATLLGLLRKEEPFILVTRDGPTFLALARRFGLLASAVPKQLEGTDLPPGDVLEVLTRWARYRAMVEGLDRAGEHLAMLQASGAARHGRDADAALHDTQPEPAEQS